jgi:hypothetical protein
MTRPATERRRVRIRHATDGGRYYALIIDPRAPRDRRSILERTPLRDAALEAIAEAELMAHGRGWRVISVRPLAAGYFRT